VTTVDVSAPSGPGTHVLRSREGHDDTEHLAGQVDDEEPPVLLLPDPVVQSFHHPLLPAGSTGADLTLA
jgi:hypothetical protein